NIPHKFWVDDVVSFLQVHPSTPWFALPFEELQQSIVGWQTRIVKNTMLYKSNMKLRGTYYPLLCGSGGGSGAIMDPLTRICTNEQKNVVTSGSVLRIPLFETIVPRDDIVRVGQTLPSFQLYGRTCRD